MPYDHRIFDLLDKRQGDRQIAYSVQYSPVLTVLVNVRLIDQEGCVSLIETQINQSLARIPSGVSISEGIILQTHDCGIWIGFGGGTDKACSEQRGFTTCLDWLL